MAEIFFDLDGVLIHSRRRDKTFLWSENIHQVLGIDRSLKELLFRQPEWGEIICGRMDFEPYLRRVFAENRVSASVEEFISFWLRNDLNWYQDVLELLVDLKEAGHQLFIASNQDRLRGSFVRERDEIKSIISDVFTSADFGVAKPEIDFFKKLKEQAGDRFRGIPLMIDDARSNIKSACEEGFRAIHFDPDLEPQHTAAWLREQINGSLP